MIDLVTLDKEDDCWRVTLNRPDKRNALSAQMVEQLIEVVEQAHNAQPTMLVLQGAGKNFSAGFDFSDLAQHSEGDLLWRFVRIEQLLQMLDALPILTVALAHGQNFGAGVDLMAVCKHRVAAPDAKFRMPGLKFGLVLGTRRLGKLVGSHNARGIQQEAKTLTAMDAHAVNLLSAVAQIEDWPEMLQQQQQIARSLSPAAKTALYRVLRHDSDDADMAELVRSVTAPGLKDRVATYLAAR